MAETVRVIAGTALSDGHATPGMDRRLALDTGSMWSGLVHTEPGAETGWHHHDGFETTLYVVSGVMRMQYGPGGEQSADAGPGDFVNVPPGVVHREVNPTADRSTAVVVRAGSGTHVVNVEGPDPG
ncbi:MAG: cupin domain-containing protein [Geodermatophilaceae bacterium]